MGDWACAVLGRGAVVPVGLGLTPWGLLPSHPFSALLPAPLALAPQTLALPQARSFRFCLCCQIAGVEIRSSRLPVCPPGL